MMLTYNVALLPSNIAAVTCHDDVLGTCYSIQNVSVVEMGYRHTGSPPTYDRCAHLTYPSIQQHRRMQPVHPAAPCYCALYSATPH